MKETVGKANMTIVTIIIELIVALATPIINGIMSNVRERTECMNNGGT